jgi:hypothetical protein
MCWSKAFMFYGFGYSMMTPGWKLQIRFCDPNNAFSVIGEIEYPIMKTSDAIIAADIQHIIDTYLVYKMPTKLTTAVSEQVEESVGNVKNICVQYRPWAPGMNLAWTTDNYFPFIVKGGYSNMMPFNEKNINMGAMGGFNAANFYPTGSRFLTFIPSGRYMLPNEWGWLMYLPDLGATVDGPSQKVYYLVAYADGTGAILPSSIPNSDVDYFGHTWYIPMGVQQAKIDPDSKGVLYYDIVVRREDTGANLAIYRVNVDNRTFYDTITLYYRNSLGGIDHICLRDNVELFGGQTDKKETRQHRTLAGNYNGESPYYHSQVRPMFKGSTGYISKGHKNALIELYNSREAWLLKNGEWLGIRIPAQKYDGVNSRDGMHAAMITYEAASQFETTPKQINSL